MLGTIRVRKYLFLEFVILLGTLASGADAALRQVPQEGTIQEVINDANDGDIITITGGNPADPCVYSGTGYYDIDFGGKNVILQAIPGTAVIDCCGLGRAFIFENNEDSNCIVTGLTIINGYAEDNNWPQEPNVDTSGYGGAIYCTNSRPEILNCIITDCVADAGGGAIFCYVDGDARITDCKISFNYAGYGFYKYGVHPNDANVVNLKLRGGGIYCKESKPWVRKLFRGCEISWNRVAGAGGGIACEDSNAIITDCNIFQNDAWLNDDRVIQHGGGVYCELGSPFIERSDITRNNARWSGGGVAVLNGNGVWINECHIMDNDSWASGGGIYGQGPYDTNTISDPNIINDPNIPLTPSYNVRKTVISDNYGYWCGGVASDYGSAADIDNCVIANNVASWSHGPCLVGGLECYYGIATVRNSVIWGNTGLQVSPNDVVAVDIAFSDVQIIDSRCYPDSDPCHVWPGLGNLNKDPMFIDPIRRNYHVKDANIPIDPNVGAAAYAMMETMEGEEEISPCINAGDPFADFSREPMPNGGRVNIGAYGNTEQAARSDIKRPVPGDVDSDLNVNMVDFAKLADDWLREGASIKNRYSDADNNGIVDERDLAILSKFWLWIQ